MNCDRTPRHELGGKYKRRLSFKGISLEQKWKAKHENETYDGSKSGGQFMRTVIDYKGRNS